MFDWKIIESHSVLLPGYLTTCQERFPKVQIKSSDKEVHLAIYQQEKLVGGVTLLPVDSLADDKDIAAHWDVKTDMKAVRMLRLWADPVKGDSVLPHIFQAVLSYTDQDSFLFGLLSLPLSYARKKSQYLDQNRGWLSPKCDLASCNWDPEMEPSSEGNKLLITYLKAGADILGPVSGDPSTYSVRVVMGMKKTEVTIPGKGVLYA